VRKIYYAIYYTRLRKVVFVKGYTVWIKSVVKNLQNISLK